MKESTKKLYPANWKEISLRIRKRYHYKCQRCFTKSKPKFILTVHHLDINPVNCNLSNLVLLCQKCHLHIQSKGIMDMNSFYQILNEQEEIKRNQKKLFTDYKYGDNIVMETNKLLKRIKEEQCQKKT